jgi:hypothetical protein
VIKVADFGLSEDVYCKDYFRQALSGNKQEEGVIKLPIKWMALESLSDGIFTEKTDVVSCYSNNRQATLNIMISTCRSCNSYH